MPAPSTISRLLGVKWLGDEKLATFDLNWENVLSGCTKEIEESTKRALYLEQLRKSARLRQDIAHYDRLSVDDTDTSYQWLMDMVVSDLERNHMAATSD